jgi:serine/threonine protein kinase
LRGLPEVGPGVDIWALGVVAYECLLGQRPFHALSLAGLAVRICSDPLPLPSEVGSVPAGFDQWFAQACERDPRQRFQRAHDLAQAFERLLSASPAAVDVTSPSLAKSAEPKNSFPMDDESTGGIARSQSEMPRANRPGQAWVYGAGAAVVAFGVLSYIIARSPDPRDEASADSHAVSVRRDAGTPSISAAVGDAGTSKDAQIPSADGGTPLRTDTDKASVRPVRRSRRGGTGTDKAPLGPAGKTDGVYGF